MSVETTLWYLEDRPLYQSTKPYVINLPLSQIPTGKRTNQVCKAYENVKVADIRAASEKFTLDRNGFELSTSIPLMLQYEDFEDRVKVRDIYCENVKRYLLEMTGAESAHLLHQAVGVVPIFSVLDVCPTRFNLMCRFAAAITAFPRSHAGVWMLRQINPYKVFTVVVIDYTPRQAYDCLRAAYGDGQAKELWDERRIQILQAWRPLRGPVLDWPLGVCDTTSVNSASDLVPTDNIWSYAALETYNVFHNPDHSWYYVSNQTSEDVILFKGFDSAEGVPTFCPHAAFKLSDVGEVSRMRESVECAVLLVHSK